MYEEAIDEAIEIANQGWCKRTTINNMGDETYHCAIGCFVPFAWGTSMALDEMDAKWPGLLDALGDVALEMFPERLDEFFFVEGVRNTHHFFREAIVGFNDHMDTRREDVIQVFEKVRAKEQI